MSDERWTAVEEGIELLQIGQLEEALAELSAVAERNPENEYAHYFLGQSYFELEDFARALKCYVRALEIVPKYVGAMLGAGHSLRMLGDHGKALRMAQHVLRLKKDDPDALYLAGVLHFQRDEKPQARTMLERFLQTNPEVEVALEVEGMLSTLRDPAPEPE